MLQPFELHQPSSAEAASALLADFGEDARLYAGGTELLLVMKNGLLTPRHLIDIKRIPQIAAIGVDAATGALRIGAAATHRQIERSAVVGAQAPTLAGLASTIANFRVRATGTIGGNLCFAEPHADPGALLLVYEASAHIERSGTSRALPIDDFFVGPFEVALEPDEVLTRLDLPLLPPRSGSAYHRFVTLEWPSVGVAASVTLSEDGAGVEDVRIGIGCVGPRPIRARAAEARLRGLPVAEMLAALDAASSVAASETEVIEDRAGPADYKQHLIGVLTRRAVREAYTRAQATNGPAQALAS